MFCSLFAESHVFDDSEDEYEDDYTESIILIRDLDKRIDEKKKSNEQLQEPSNIATEAAAGTASDTQAVQKKSQKTDNQMQNRFKVKNAKTSFDAPKETSNSAVRTRSTNRLKPMANQTKITETNIVYDPNGQTIEVLSVMEDIGDDDHGGTEYIITDDFENAFVEPFPSADSNDEDLEALIANSEQQFENDSFSLKNVTKSEELLLSEESMDDIDMKTMVDVEDEGEEDSGKKKCSYNF